LTFVEVTGFFPALGGGEVIICLSWLLINLLNLDNYPVPMVKKALNSWLKCVDSPALPWGWGTGFQLTEA